MAKGKYKIGGRNLSWWLALVAVGALLGIKAIGCDLEHIVALDADAVNDRAHNGAGLERLILGRGAQIGGFFWPGPG